MFKPGFPPHRDEAIAYLTRLARHSADPQFEQMVRDRDAVYRQYGHLFYPDRLDRMTAQDFKEFLLYDNNRHWWGIHRHQAKLVADMGVLRRVLGVLLDESTPIERRLNLVEPDHGVKPLPGLGKAVFTPILHVVYPDLYGVWNSVAQNAMSRLGLWPRTTSMTFGAQYVAVNQRIRQAASEVGVDLWTIDSLWWLTENEHEPTAHQFTGGGGGGTGSGSTRRIKAPQTFVCSTCYQTKSVNLRSAQNDTCTDCS